MKKKTSQSPKKPTLTVKLPKQKTQELAHRQYTQAMLHVKKFNTFEAQRKVYVEPLDPECTFKPRLYTESYKGIVKSALNSTKRVGTRAENRLIQWGKEKEKKHIEKVLNYSVEVQTNVIKNLRVSLEKKPASYTQKHLLSNTISFHEQPTGLQKSSYLQKGMNNKQQSQSTLLGSNIKSRSSLYP